MDFAYTPSDEEEEEVAGDMDEGFVDDSTTAPSMSEDIMTVGGGGLGDEEEDEEEQEQEQQNDDEVCICVLVII